MKPRILEVIVAAPTLAVDRSSFTGQASRRVRPLTAGSAAMIDLDSEK
jgi:hypothetical protein